jgi:hypothetical protein
VPGSWSASSANHHRHHPPAFLPWSPTFEEPKPSAISSPCTRNPKSCAGCHARFDPVGLALENFDILGGWRTRYRGLEEGERITGIDRAGHDYAYTLAAQVDASGKLLDGRSFQNIRELKAHLAANPRQLASNLLHQLTIYATGTPVRFSDRPEIESMLDRMCEEWLSRAGFSSRVDSKPHLPWRAETMMESHLTLPTSPNTLPRRRFLTWRGRHTEHCRCWSA